MKIISINTSLPKEISNGGKHILTGIFKEPTSNSVSVKKSNIEGDRQADNKYHGGACKAVYVYPYEHYHHWCNELCRTDFSYGQFGENLTTTGLLEEEIYIGDVLNVGTTLFEVTQPRVPCFKLGIKMGYLNEFPQRFLKSGLVGFYLRVLEEGNIVAGDLIIHKRMDSESLSVREIHNAMHFDKRNLTLAKKAVGIDALAPGWRRKFEKRLVMAGEPFTPKVHPLESSCCVSL